MRKGIVCLSLCPCIHCVIKSQTTNQGFLDLTAPDASLDDTAEVFERTEELCQRYQSRETDSDSESSKSLSLIRNLCRLIR